MPTQHPDWTKCSACGCNIRKSELRECPNCHHDARRQVGDPACRCGICNNSRSIGPVAMQLDGDQVTFHYDGGDRASFCTG